MTIHELTREQLRQVKQNYYTQKQDASGKSVSYGELSMIDELVTDQEIFDAYDGTNFVPDDFA